MPRTEHFAVQGKSVRTVPVRVQGLTSVSAIAVGGGDACALIDGAMKCWGDNYFGGLGNNSRIDSPVPVQVQGLTGGVSAIAAGSGGATAVASDLNHACAVVNGAVQCWGYNYFGQLGNKSVTSSWIPVTSQLL